MREIRHYKSPCQANFGNWKLEIYPVTQVKIRNPKSKIRNHIFLLYCPPTLNNSLVICPSEQYFAASINASNTLPFVAAL